MPDWDVLANLLTEMSETDFLLKLSEIFDAEESGIPHTEPGCEKSCTLRGSGSAFINDAIASGADAFVTADIKYHDFFNAENKILTC